MVITHVDVKPTHVPAVYTTEKNYYFLLHVSAATVMQWILLFQKFLTLCLKYIDMPVPVAARSKA